MNHTPCRASPRGSPTRGECWRVWPISGLVFSALFAGGLLFADLIADRTFPRQGASTAEIVAYFSNNGPEARSLALFHSLAALALLVFVAGCRDLIRGEGSARILSGVAFGGGVMATVFLLISAAIFWALGRSSTARDPAVARALHDLSFLAGGQVLALTLAAFIGAVSLAGS